MESARSLALAFIYPEQVTGRAFLATEFPGGVATALVNGLRRLELSGCKNLETRALEWIAAGCTALDDLVVSRCGRITPQGLENLVASPPAVKRLGVAGCGGLDDAALSFVANRAQSLEHLDISDMPALGGRVVALFLRKCLRLVSIDVSGLPLVNRASLADFTHLHSGASPSRTRKGNLVGGVRVEAPARPQLGESLSRLLTARMLRLPGIDDASITAFARACPHLEELLLSDSPMITGACLEAVSSLCPLLRSLGLDRCRAASDEAAVSDALRKLPSLEHLAVAREGYGSGAVTGSGACGAPPKKSVPTSRRAPFGDVRAAGAAADALVPGESFTGAALAAASSSCSRLESLGLEGHRKVTFAEADAPAGSFPCLKELRLESCAGVDDDGLGVLLRACPLLRTLLLQGSSVTARALAAAARGRPLVELIPPPPRDQATRPRGEIAASPLSSITGHPVCNPPPPPKPERRRGTALAGESTSGVSRAPRAKAGDRGAYPRDPDPDGRETLGGVGFRPVAHADLYAMAQAVEARLERERMASSRIAGGLRAWKRERAQRRAAAASRIQRALRAFHFRVSKGHPDQVWAARLALGARLRPS